MKMGCNMSNSHIQKQHISINQRIIQNKLSNRAFFSLMMRTLLFILFGAIIVGLFALLGNETPLQAAEKWWPFQAILSNIATYFILRMFMKKEGLTYLSIFNYEKGRKKRDALETLWLLVVGMIVGAIPLYLCAYLLLGTFRLPTTMFQEIPLWALIIALVVFPLSNAFVEIPTYLGYALPRIEAGTGKQWLAILLAGLALALQHIALPLVFDLPYMLWRFLSFLPLALVLALIYTRTKRLFPIVLAHFLMDLQLVIQLATMTVM